VDPIVNRRFAWLCKAQGISKSGQIQAWMVAAWEREQKRRKTHVD
jgi:hypothetical protein